MKMSTNYPYTSKYDSIDKIIRIILQIFLGAFVGGIYRIVRYLETKNTTTLIVGILALIPPIDFIFWIIDLVHVITKDKISLCVD